VAFPILGVISAVSDIIGRFIPDPQKAAEAKLKMLEMAQAGDLKELEANLQIAVAQVAANSAEAASGDSFARRWRPFIGWTCGVAMAYNFVLLPLLVFVSTVWFGVDAKLIPPSMDLATMLPVLLGMLGLGGMRSFERSQGKA